MRANQFRIFYPIAFIIMVVAIMFALLVLTYSVTKDELEARQYQQTLDMLKGIFPEASSYALEDNIYTIYDNSRYEIGYAFYAKCRAWGGEINILVGLEDKETIKGMIVVSDYEHPAYRDLLVESNFTDQFIWLKIDDCVLKKDDGKVHGVAMAAVTSRAVVDAVRETALEKVKSIR